MKKNRNKQVSSKADFRANNRPLSLRKLILENLEERQLLSASAFVDVAAINDLTSNAAIVQ